MAIKMPPSFIARPSKIYPNLDFWFEDTPSGNRGRVLILEVVKVLLKVFRVFFSKVELEKQ
jgi:hypothetical protein